MYTNLLMVAAMVVLFGALCVEGSRLTNCGGGPFFGMMLSFILIVFALLSSLNL